MAKRGIHQVFMMNNWLIFMLWLVIGKYIKWIQKWLSWFKLPWCTRALVE